MEKIRKVIRFEDLPHDALEAVRKKYPEGWKDFIRKVTKPNGEFFYAFNIDTDNASYLVKVNVKVDSKSDIEKLNQSIIEKDSEKDTETDSDDDEPVSGDDD